MFMYYIPFGLDFYQFVRISFQAIAIKYNQNERDIEKKLG